MVKDYFQDIVPPAENSRSSVGVRKLRPSTPPEEVPMMDTSSPESSEIDYVDDTLELEPETASPPPRGIRSINIPGRSRPRPSIVDARDMPSLGRNYPRRGSTLSRGWIWGLAGVSVLSLGLLGLFVFRDTTVTLLARSRAITFDQSAQFIAYPSGTVATGTLSYTRSEIKSSDSETVDGTGTVAAQMKASGTVTVYNNYSISSVRLVKNTRFETPSGLLFRAPADILIPGKHGTVPGRVDVTIVADQAGQEYNIAPIPRLSIPGLKSNVPMYANVYAQSSKPMEGGFAGNQVGVADAVRKAAVAAIRARLAQEISRSIESLNSATSTVFAELAQVTYVDMPDVDDTNGKVHIYESVRAEVPILDPNILAASVAHMSNIDINNSLVTLSKGTGYGALMASSTPIVLGTDALNFSLVGQASLVWNIDTRGLAQALAGKDQSVFQTLIGGFPGIETAHARIEPFWKSTFPTDPSKIHMILENQHSVSNAASQ